MATFTKATTILALLLVFGLLLRFSLLFYIFHGDVYNHIEWGMVALHRGLYGIYELPSSFWKSSRINQPPFTIYTYLFIRFSYEQIDRLLWFLNNNIGFFPSKFLWFYEWSFYPAMLKVPSCLADIGLGVVIYEFAKPYMSKSKALLASLLYIFNPVAIYDSAVWGQTDGIVNFFAILAFYLIIKKKLFWAMVAFATSLMFKASLSIFVPVFLVLLYRQQYKLLDIAKYAAITLAFIFVVTLPYHAFSDPLWLPRIYINNIVFGTLGNVTENAFNVWAYFFGPLNHVLSSTKFFGLRASTIGYGLFGLSLVGSLSYFYKKFSIESLFVTLVIVGSTSFLFLVGMHERYLFPTIVPLCILLSFSVSYAIFYILFTTYIFLNMYYQWWVPRAEWLVQWLSQMKTIQELVIFLFVLVLAFTVYSVNILQKCTPHPILENARI